MYKHLLFATDLTTESEQLAERAKQMADLFGAKLSIVHVVEPTILYADVNSVYTDILKENQQHAEQLFLRYIQKFAIPQEHCFLRTGKPKRAIAECAKDIGADLLLMASHGVGGAAHAMGTTTSSTLNFVHCDMFIFNMRDTASLSILDAGSNTIKI